MYLGFVYLNPNTGKLAQGINAICKKYLPGNLKANSFCKHNRMLLSAFSKKYKYYRKDEGPGVYNIDCKDCSKCYIGETGRKLDMRIKEHSRLAENSALSAHVNGTKHQMDFENAKVLFGEANPVKRKILESLCLKHYAHFENNTGWDLLIYK